MGEHSWRYADTGEQMVNNRVADSYLLVPPAFQEKYGKYIKTDRYDGYGNFGRYQINELIAEWNESFIPEVIGLMKKGEWYCDWAKKGEIPSTTVLERYIMNDHDGMVIQEREWVGCILSANDENNSRLPNPIKITTKPMGYDEVGYSLVDPYQGWLKDKWDDEDIEFLSDHFEFDFDPDDEDRIIVDGVSYEIEINLSNDVPDYAASRVKIGEKYYYF